MKRNREHGPVRICSKLDHILDGAGLHVLEAARRQPQPVGERLEVVFRRDTERPRLAFPVLHEDVAKPESRLLDDVLEHDRHFALRRQGPDIDHVHRLGDAGDDIGIGVEVGAQGFVGRGIGWSGREMADRQRRHGSLHLLK